MAYEVHIEVYDGPLDLLLHLIGRREVDLYEVSLESIVDAYLAELDRMRGPERPLGAGDGVLDLDVATEFLLIAATLVELKSRRLLPDPPPEDPADELALLEERDLLVARLLECLTFRGAGAAIARLSAEADASTPRSAGPEGHLLALMPDFLAGVEPEHLRRALMQLSIPAPVPRVDLAHVTVVRATVAEAMDDMVARLPGLGRSSLRCLANAADGRIGVIVAFLAALELYKQGLVDLDQTAAFGPLEVIWVGSKPDIGALAAAIEGDQLGDLIGRDLMGAR